MVEPIIFYDIPSKPNASGRSAWSPNTWKTRFTLNVKGIPYRTVWVEYPDIEPLCKKLGTGPTDKHLNGSPKYTLPTIYDPNTKVAVSESLAIARYLDKTYPDTPAVIPKEVDAFHAAFLHAFIIVILAPGDFFRIMLAPICNSLNDRSREYFQPLVEALLGEKLSEMAPAGSDKYARHWENTQKQWHTVAEWFRADGEEKLFFMGGDQPCYADINLASFLGYVKILCGEDSKEWQDILRWDGGRWARFLKAFKQYETVDVGSPLVA